MYTVIVGGCSNVLCGCAPDSRVARGTRVLSSVEFFLLAARVSIQAPLTHDFGQIWKHVTDDYIVVY